MLVDLNDIIDENSAFETGFALNDKNNEFVEIDPSAIDPKLVCIS